MKTNKLDNNIRKKFENRTFMPSTSAWERLSVQLDEQPKKKKLGWFFYIGTAASILLLVSLGIQLLNKDSQEIIPEEEIVISPVDTKIIDDKIEDFVNEIPVEEAYVNNNSTENEEHKTSELNIIAKKEQIKTKKISPNPIIKEKKVIAKVEEEAYKIQAETNDVKFQKPIEKEVELLLQDPNSSIKINANDLLYAVTHSPKEVKEYYAKYNVDKEVILKTIRNELKKSNIQVNPNIILAEVERTIDDDDFQNNFMKSLKRRVSDIASAIASRNN